MSVPEAGQVLAGKYRVERVLGQGGMGVVVQAMHVQLDERVAMKFLLPEYASHPEASTRFLREARAAVKIKSEHVARVVDVGTLETGAPYMVMEFLQGRDLSAVISQEGTLSIPRAVDYLLQACEAIAEAHAAGIVHRDLKPANLFLTQRADRSAVVKVLDFGISKVTVPTDSGADMSLTKTTTMMGSPLYMSPEQMRSARHADARSDQWSLAAILYELVGGTPPFTAESLPELCAKIIGDPPKPLAQKRADVPPAFDAVIARALAKNPADRYPSISELSLALLPFGEPHSRTSVERISRVMEAAGLSTSRPGLDDEENPVASATLVPWGQTQRGQSARSVVTIAAAVVLVGGGVAAFALTRGKEEPAPPSSAHATAGAPGAPKPAGEPGSGAPADKGPVDEERIGRDTVGPAVVPAPAGSEPSARPKAARTGPRASIKSTAPPKPAGEIKPAPGPEPKKPDLFEDRK